MKQAIDPNVALAAPPGADSPGLFHRKRVGIMIILAIVGLVIALLANVFGEDNKSAAPDPTLASESALGHAAFVSLVERLDLGGGISFSPLMALLGGDDMQVFLEPNPAEVAPVDFQQRLKGSVAFVVLPKWVAISDAERPRWIAKAAYMERKAVQDMARAVAADLDVRRLPAPVVFAPSPLKYQPTLTRPQLMGSAKLTPIIASPQGILFGKYKRGKTMVYVLSDPDLLNNHGLDNGDNAVLAVRMLDLARGKSAVQFDSSVQKFRGSISLWRQLFLPPLLGLVLLSLFSVAVLVWHILVRLAPPQMQTQGLAAGKRGLIENSASLFDSNQHDGFLKQRYLDSALAEIAAVLPMVARSNPSQRAALLDDVSARRATFDTFSALSVLAQAPQSGVVSTARRINSWKQEIMRGLS